MWYTIKELWDHLHYIDSKGERVQLIGEQAIKLAAIEGKVEARKNEKGRWLINPDCDGVKKWESKKRKAEAAVREENEDRAKRKAAREEVEGLKRKVAELESQLKEERQRTRDLSADLRSAQADLEMAKADAKRQIRLAKIEESNAKQELETVKKVSEERERMLSQLLGTITPQNGSQASPKPSKAASDAAGAEKSAVTTKPRMKVRGPAGKELIRLWEDYQRDNPDGTFTAFAQEVGVSRRTLSDRLKKAQEASKN